MRLLGKTTDFWWKEFVLLKNQDSWKKEEEAKEVLIYLCIKTGLL